MSAAGERVALVTGGARGLGFACAERLADDGMRVALLDLDGDAAAAAAARLGEGHLGVGGDVTAAQDVAAALARTTAALGAPTVLVNNAGLLRPTRFLEISEAEWDAVLAVTVKGAFLCSQACLPAMVAAGFGRIVNFSSTAGKNVSTLGGAHYTTAKAAMLGLTRAVAKEHAAHGVTVNAVCPGLFSTEMTLQTVPADVLERYAASFPIPRLGTPEEVGALVAFLCSENAAYITGAALDINGGDLMV
ncbi:MAG TPA: SDR family NAD(P)-dependent oxidoreductase [Conexibacter sp.]|nr:SDR family NAD(P)-dependent oxidoreductase [Conexibacter sp.]